MLFGRTTSQTHLIADGEHFDVLVRGHMAEAAVSIDIATANLKAMQVPTGRKRSASILEVLAEIARRGVEVRLLHAGVPSEPALQQMRGERPAQLTIRRCPRVHAKLIVIDSRLLYIGSANLTGAGLGAKSERRRNFELGTLSTDEQLIDEVSSYFNTIWEGEPCATCGRRDVCPVPLEEPDL